MSIKSLTITGYKPHELNIFSERDEKIKVIKESLRRKLEYLLDQGLEWVIISGQQGVETWAFDVVQDLKEQHDLKLALIPPFLDQEKIWKEDKQEKYEEMTVLADFYEPLIKRPYEGPKQYFIKNKWLIGKTDACLIIYEEEFGGSPKYFYDLARKRQQLSNYEIIHINAYDLEDIARELTEGEN